MEKLITKLKTAPEGSRELDFAIAKEIGWTFHGDAEFKEWGNFWRDSTTDEWQQLPWWTTNLNAAWNLILKGWTIANLYESSNPNDRPWCGAVLRRDEPYCVVKALGAKTLPLTLCLAALKAFEIEKLQEE